MSFDRYDNPWAHYWKAIMDKLAAEQNPQALTDWAGTQPTADASAEQKARDLLERIGVENAQRFSAGDLAELANLIAATEHAAPVRFPTPSAGWGTVTHAVVFGANPNWRWWAFWRPRHVSIDIPMPDKVVGPGDTMHFDPGSITITK